MVLHSGCGVGFVVILKGVCLWCCEGVCVVMVLTALHSLSQEKLYSFS